ncbi:NETI motif-containing protein [Pseudalkalibacillus caeni]|uniref:NETI motif-containing protein n=1 Tax=Exobacillus caeni TaxID=2574798 RepID=A0A5R9F3F7_9BACL|nr:NETI motif-containing protein [Pseudalkalibacillus caeni]TLS34964.1 NETI motif-containing protein [Pseudalkalibacillus caeni]
MDKKPKKKKFEVQPGESLSDCLKRMDEEGYLPVRRREEPVFIESKDKSKKYEHHEQRIVFEGKLK